MTAEPRASRPRPRSGRPRSKPAAPPETVADLEEKLRSLEAMRAHFLSIASHELRTPLTIVKGALNLILTEGEKLGPERQHKYLLMATKNTDRVIHLLNELLDISRLEMGYLKLELAPVDSIQLVKDTIEEFRQEAELRGLQLAYRIPQETPVLTADYNRLKQVLSNLLSNAMKFTPNDGNILLRISVEPRTIEFVVEDNGAGIPVAEQKTVFQRYLQGDQVLTREAQGVGLGLAIVKELVQLHDGEVRVKSEAGRGSSFSVRLPLAGPAHPEKVALARSSEGWEPPKVLGK